MFKCARGNAKSQEIMVTRKQNKRGNVGAVNSEQAPLPLCARRAGRVMPPTAGCMAAGEVSSSMRCRQRTATRRGVRRATRDSTLLVDDRGMIGSRLPDEPVGFACVCGEGN
jgi:hypothetical protein